MHESGRRGRLLPKASIEDEIAQLRDLDLKALRIRWRNAFGKPAPEHLSRYLLFRIIAYRLQADRFGDLDGETLAAQPPPRDLRPLCNPQGGR